MRTLTALAILAGLCAAQPVRPGRNSVPLHGRLQDVYYLPAIGQPEHAPETPVVFLSGQRGWLGFAIETARVVASWGHPVYGLDTRRYLAGLNLPDAPATRARIRDDLGALGKWVQHGDSRKLILAGWGAGAELGILALSVPENRAVYRGMAAIAYRSPDQLGPAEVVAPFLPLIPPAPLLVLHSTTDPQTPPGTIRQLFRNAREPKLLKLIDGRDRDFDGNHEGLFQALRDGLGWIARTSR